MLTDLPVGLWTGSLLLDLVGARKSAGVMSAAGSTAAVAAAVTGVADWTSMHGRTKRLALVHGMLNGAGLLFQLMSLTARLRWNRGSAFRLSLLGWTVSSTAAYIGGELVFSRGQMVNHTAWTEGPSEWTPVAAASAITEGATHKGKLEERAVLLYKQGGRIYALEDTCSHAGGPLSEGEVKDGIVTCPWHGSQFRLTDGAVMRGPSCYAQLRLETRTRGGQVEVRGRQG
jgi:nitrite reductase/ring-hydroxylating ferredoxin subunit